MNKKKQTRFRKEKNELERNAELVELEKEGTKRSLDYFKGKIKTLLENQVKITRSKDILLIEKNRSFLAELSEFFDANELNNLCELQIEVTKWEMKRENMEKIFSEITETERDERKQRVNVVIAPIMPSQWIKVKEESTLKENYSIEKNCKYKQIIEKKSSVWKIERNKPLTLEELPIKLYDTSGKFDEDNPKKNVKRKEECGDIESYAMLSYMWGEPGGVLSSGGKKSLLKAIEACRLLDIKYLWIDQLCINQDDPEEKSQEIPKMRQYYANSDVTLIAMHLNLHEGETEQLPNLPDILKKVIRSDWFKRSWTFQEGWLSKQTLFMFDDGLVDGRAMASIWALHQPSYTEYGKYNSLNEFYEGSKKIATPLGWAYYKDGYKPEDTVSLRLHETLREIKNRGRGISVDGIYSILGLLPYGEKVEVKYKEWGHEYTQEELQEALRSVIKAAVENGHGEHLAWHGSGDGWMPKINEDGSTSVAGGVRVDYKETNHKIGNVFINDDNIEIVAMKYNTETVHGYASGIEESEGFMIEGGAHVRKVSVGIGNEHEDVTLLGTKETLEKVKIDDTLIILSEKEWKISKPFAILASREGNVYHRKGLVEFLLKSDAEKLKSGEEKKITMATNSSQEIEPLKNDPQQHLSGGGEKKQNETETIQQQGKNQVEAQINKLKTKFLHPKQKENLESKNQSYIQIPPK